VIEASAARLNFLRQLPTFDRFGRGWTRRVRKSRQGQGDGGVRFFRDILMGIGNTHWDIARATAMWAVFSYSFAFLYALIRLEKVPDWSALGIGYAAVLAGAVAFVAGKDIGVAKANATTAAADAKP
jgi:hypothetical protein